MQRTPGPFGKSFSARRPVIILWTSTLLLWRYKSRSCWFQAKASAVCNCQLKSPIDVFCSSPRWPNAANKCDRWLIASCSGSHAIGRRLGRACWGSGGRAGLWGVMRQLLVSGVPLSEAARIRRLQGGSSPCRLRNFRRTVRQFWALRLWSGRRVLPATHVHFCRCTKKTNKNRADTFRTIQT